jgi:HlyD family secretion protein
VDYWRAQNDKTVIRTPISGTVLSLDVQQGETIAAGLSAPTLIRVTDLHRLQVDAFVDETDVGSVEVGQPATITVDAYPNRTFRGRVVKIASGATMQENVVTYDTTVTVDNPERLLKPDMTATVRIIVGQRRDVLAVPIEAVKPGPRGQVVYVLEGTKIVPHRVVTGISNDILTEIIHGLRAGDTIVLAGYQPQGQGGPVRMTPLGPMGGARPAGGGGGGGRAGGR